MMDCLNSTVKSFRKQEALERIQLDPHVWPELFLFIAGWMGYIGLGDALF
jgi:hypothetical protein